MQGITLSSDRIGTIAAGVTSVGDQLTREIANMYTLLGDLRSGWQSTEAAPRFANLMEAHLDGAVVMKNALLSHGASLTTTGHGFAEAESSLAGAIPVG